MYNRKIDKNEKYKVSGTLRISKIIRKTIKRTGSNEKSQINFSM